MAKWKTQKQYLKSPYRCPKCDSENISASEVEFIDGGETIQDIKCMACDAKWRDVYKLVEYERKEE